MSSEGMQEEGGRAEAGAEGLLPWLRSLRLE